MLVRRRKCSGVACFRSTKKYSCGTDVASLNLLACTLHDLDIFVWSSALSAMRREDY